MARDAARCVARSHRGTRRPRVALALGARGHDHRGCRFQLPGRAAHGRSLPQAAGKPSCHRPAAVHHRPLAVGHDDAPRAVDARRPLLLPDDVSVLRARPLSAHRAARDERPRLDHAFQAADGRRLGGLAQAAGRRVRPRQHGIALSLPAHGVSHDEPRSAPGPRPRHAVAGRARPLEAKPAAVSRDAGRARSAAAGAQEPAPHGPRRRARGDVSGGPVSARGARSVRRVSFDHAPVALAAPLAGAASRHGRGPRALRVRRVRRDVCGLRTGSGHAGPGQAPGDPLRRSVCRPGGSAARGV